MLILQRHSMQTAKMAECHDKRHHVKSPTHIHFQRLSVKCWPFVCSARVLGSLQMLLLKFGTTLQRLQDKSIEPLAHRFCGDCR